MKIKILILIFIFSLKSVYSEIINNESMTDVATIIESKRYSDLDTNEFHFEIKLNNGQIYKVLASLQDLIDKKLDVDTQLSLIEETFLPDQPGYSHVNYETLDGNFKIEGTAPSIHSHWQPDPIKNPVIEIQAINYVRFGMSNFRYDIKFSDDTWRSIHYLVYPRDVFKTGDQFFKIGENQKLVNVSTGRVLEFDASVYNKYVQINW